MNRARSVIIIASAILVPLNSADAATAQESWSDPNFAFCEGVGAGASGRINARAEYSFDDPIITLNSLAITTTGYSFEHIAAGEVTYLDDAGKKRNLSLQQPWFDVIGSAGPGDVLYLPRNKVSSTGPGPWEQMSIKLISDSPLQISLSLLFTVDGGSCPTSFAATWELPEP